MIKLALTTIASVALFAASTFAAPEVGKPAPDFTAMDTSGAKVTLSDFKDKTVVLEWHNPECPFVKKHYDSKNMQRLQSEARDLQIIWLTINSSAEGKQGHMNQEQAAKFVNDTRHGSNHYLLDSNGAIGQLYGAKTTPHMFVIDKGNVVYMGAIDDKATTDVKDIEGAHNYVIAALSSLQAHKPVEVSSTQPYGCGVKYAN